MAWMKVSMSEHGIVIDLETDSQDIQEVREEIKVLLDAAPSSPQAARVGNDLLNTEFIKEKIQEALEDDDISHLLNQIRKQKAAKVASRIVTEYLRPAPKELVVYTLDELDQLPKPTPLLGECLGESTLAMLLGKFGSFKSFLALDWACCVATGRPWRDQASIGAFPVVYVAAEGHVGLRKRIHAWEHFYGRVKLRSNFVLLPEAIPLNSEQAVQNLTEQVRSRGAKLLVIDTLHKCCPGIEENSATEMGEVIGNLNQLREATGCTVLMVHHTGHTGTRARGSSSLEDDVDTSWLMSLDDEESRNPTALRTLSHRKSKDGDYLNPRSFTLKMCPPESKIDSGVLEDATIEQKTDAVMTTLHMDLVLLGELDALDFPKVGPGSGYRQIRTALKDAGHTVSEITAKRLAKHRKGEQHDDSDSE